MCILRVTGPKYPAAEIADKYACLTGSDIYLKGERRFPKSKRNTSCYTQSQLVLKIGKAEFLNLDGEIKDAIKYLKKQQLHLRKISNHKAAKHAYLSFSAKLPINDVEVMNQSNYFPVELLMLLGKIGLSLELSLYPRE